MEQHKLSMWYGMVWCSEGTAEDILSYLLCHAFAIPPIPAQENIKTRDTQEIKGIHDPL